MPIAIPPSICPTTPSRKAGRPTSWAATTRRTSNRSRRRVDLDLRHLRAGDVHRVGLAAARSSACRRDVGVEVAVEGVRELGVGPVPGRSRRARRRPSAAPRPGPARRGDPARRSAEPAGRSPYPGPPPGDRPPRSCTALPTKNVTRLPTAGPASGHVAVSPVLDRHPLERHAELLGGDEAHGGRGPLAEVDRPGSQGRSTRPRRVQRGPARASTDRQRRVLAGNRAASPTADAVPDRRHAHPAPQRARRSADSTHRSRASSQCGRTASRVAP